MNQDRVAVEQFLRDTGMHPEAISLRDTVDHMINEMENGLAGRQSSLAMIPTYVEADAGIPSGEKVVVLDAGGTNLRAALLSFDTAGKVQIEEFSKHPMPGTRGGEVGRTEFFESLASLVEPLLDRAGKIGFCFSYPTEIYPDRDGRLIHWSKEIRAPEVEGRLIGSDLKAALADRGVSSVPEVVILNDTVATLLTGKAASSNRDWGGYVGFILGTGTNTCYVESNTSIGKNPDLDPSRHMVINCESGNFACRNRGQADRALGAATQKPETYWLEKMLSGGYFGALATRNLQLAAEAGLFSGAMTKALAVLGEISTKDADNFTHNPFGEDNALVQSVKASGTAADAERIWHLNNALLERAARLTAANLAASVLKTDGGEGPLKPYCLTIDGTTYYRYYRFQSRVESHLRPFLTERNRYYETVQVDDAPLIGAAVAALTN